MLPTSQRVESEERVARDPEQHSAGETQLPMHAGWAAEPSHVEEA